MKIGELAELTKASARSLRHYESIGLIESERLDNGYRNYAASTVERVKAIRFLLAAGLRTSTIAEILPAMMYQQCRLADPAVYSAIQREAHRIAAEMNQLARSHRLLTEALQKGELRRGSAGKHLRSGSA